MSNEHCAWLAEDGSVWTAGANRLGQLGQGDNIERNRPSRVPNLPPISSVQNGNFSTICLDTDGNLWCWGRSLAKERENNSSPLMITGIPSVISFSFSYAHAIALCEDGSVWGFGANSRGALGLGHEKRPTLPIQIPASSLPNEIISVSCGFHHSLFLTSEGQVLSCGYNGMGQLGLGDSTSRSTPSLIASLENCVSILCGGHMSCFIDTSHRLWVCGSHSQHSQNIPVCYSNVDNIQSLSVGHSQTFYINQNCELWGWGNSWCGQLGNYSDNHNSSPTLIKEQIEEVMCHGDTSFIKNTSGEIFCCGKNNSGQLGIGNKEEQHSFSKFSQEHFTPCFPVTRRKFSQKSARSALP